ncbi:hypothetical protein [Prosthecomicrobium sp. N25]|uniref:hypothetical protein n=1 Tax=Prosthecomicrobium sp. N25 TaxID=3129254 RepID=UPI003077ED07
MSTTSQVETPSFAESGPGTKVFSATSPPGEQLPPAGARPVGQPGNRLGVVTIHPVAWRLAIFLGSPRNAARLVFDTGLAIASSRAATRPSASAGAKCQDILNLKLS